MGERIFESLYEGGMKMKMKTKGETKGEAKGETKGDTQHEHRPTMDPVSEAIVENMSPERRKEGASQGTPRYRKGKGELEEEWRMRSPFRPRINEESERIYRERPGNDYMRREKNSVDQWVKDKIESEKDKTHV